MKDFLQAIQNKLTEVTRLKYVDEDWGQLDDYSPNPPAQMPCCLIDLSGMIYEDIGRDNTANPINRQTAQGNVTLTFAKVKLTNTSGKAPQSMKDQAWEIYEIIEEAHQKLHGWKPTANAGALMRKGHKRIRRDDGIQEFQIIYGMSATNV